MDSITARRSHEKTFLFLPAARLIHLEKLATQESILPRTLEAPSMALLRVALLCQLFVSVAGAADKAVAIQCLTDEPGQVYLSFAGASATAFPEEIPQADALSVAQARPCCTTTWAGRVKTTAKIRV